MSKPDTKRTIHRIGSGTTDMISVFEDDASILILSGVSIGPVVFVCGTQFVVAAGLLIAGIFDFGTETFVFSVLFLLLAIGVAVAAKLTRGHELYFEKQWLKISETKLHFKCGNVWPKETLQKIKLSTEWIPNEEGGERLGWEIQFKDNEQRDIAFQITNKNNAKRFWNALETAGFTIERFD